jgi:tetratricopeptide (TPR) repeat protein
MNYKTKLSFTRPALVVLIILFACSGKRDQMQFQSELKSLNLQRGDITLCGSGADQFGTVAFSMSCAEKVRPDFNLATSLLHSFEYTEAEKVFAKVIDGDPECIMAYWGAAMCNFHPLWAPPGPDELQKGAKIIALARSINKNQSSRESDYLEAIAAIYDQSDVLDHRTRVLKFEKASQRLFEKYPDDKEAAIFYALSLDASADPTDKTFHNQKKAGDILDAILVNEPNHPGVAHYIIHNYDYPELAQLALPAARKYASIAAASAHAQHMPSHIFTRLGLWDESIQSNINSISAAQCYAQSLKANGHWDEELHGLDYLIYAYLQKADDVKALEQLEYLETIKEVFPQNFKGGYSFASMPTRYALERKDWTTATKLKLEPADFAWDKFLWEKANMNFGRLLGAVHTHNLSDAKTELEQIKLVHDKLTQANEKYKANLVLIQIKAGEAWIKLEEGQATQAIQLMTEAADMEDATAKHPVTPGEILPARELLADMYLETGDYVNALKAYEADLTRHPNRFNGIYGAGLALERSGDRKKASQYYQQLLALTSSSRTARPQMAAVESFMKKISNGKL